jgi:cellobiose PTS system EIIA component
METVEQVSFHLIVHSGNARSLAYEAFELAVLGNFEGARAQLKVAEAEMGLAHKQQVEMIQLEAQGNPVAPTLLLVHAQDHVMTAMAEVNMMERLVRVLEIRR